jgi:hypothetical protein
MLKDQINRRDFVKKAVYTVPLIVTLKAAPAFAAFGSGNNGVGNGPDPQPRGNPPINDGPGTRPGNPGNRRRKRRRKRRGKRERND